jgi:hypothetical protein
MVIGVARLRLSIPGAGSLKEKRHALRKIIDRVRAKFNVAIAEVDHHDLWQSAVVGLAAVGNERRFVEESLDKVIGFVEEMYVAQVVERELEIQTIGDVYGQP